MNRAVAHYHLPGLFEFYELYCAFLPLYRAHREYFYDMKIEGQKLFDQLERLHRENDILGFMKKGYAFCREHEPEIRAQMR